MDAAQLLLRTKVRADIRACTSCGLHLSATAPIPFDGPSPAPILILGEAPGRTEDREGIPFCGKSGQLLRLMLEEAGFTMSELTFANTVCCFPDRTPTPGEVNACQDNLRRQLETVNPNYVIAVGGVSVSALCRTTVRMGEVRGIWFRPSRVLLRERPWVLGTYHPAAILRNQALRATVEEDLMYARLLTREEMEPELAGFCLRCKAPVEVYVDDLPWCTVHKPREKK